MATKQSKYRIIEIVTVVATIITTFTAVVGLYLLYNEFKELRLQNNYLESSLRGAYRPLMSVSQIENAGDTVEPIIKIDTLNNKVSFIMPLELSNKGTGIMFDCGYISLYTTENIDFREELLKGVIDSSKVIYDGRFPTTRPYPRLQTYKEKIYYKTNYLDKNRKYFIYILFLYKDIDNNLYDTLTLLVCDYLDVKDMYRVLVNNFFHYYNKEEQHSLYLALEKMHKGLSESIGD